MPQTTADPSALDSAVFAAAVTDAGCQPGDVVAENAGDVIDAGVLAVRFHLTVKDLTDTFAPHLTMSEGLKLAAQAFTRDPSRLSGCAV